ncbi:hypothetical protein AB1L30_08850 [Bremerella sp. JC817]|uniref:hypothetical protein n=1 Tax=Bremerella sp. JC817 TaxID=3231756 RepID=UPI0034592ED3
MRNHSLSSYTGFSFMVCLVFGMGLSLAVLSPPLGIGFLLGWALPSLLLAVLTIARHSDDMPLPWEDQIIAVVVSFVLQIPLWIVANFIGFTFGGLVFDLAVGRAEAASIEPLPQMTLNLLCWAGTTFATYCCLFIGLLAWGRVGIYNDDPNSKQTSIRDAKAIHHPF